MRSILERYKLWKKKAATHSGLLGEKGEGIQKPEPKKAIVEFETINHNVDSQEENKKSISPNLKLVKILKAKIADLPEEIKNIPFNKMELSVRANNILCRENILSPEALLQIPDEEIVKWNGLGKKSIQDILDTITIGTSLNSTECISIKETNNFILEKNRLLEDPCIDEFVKLLINQTSAPYDWLNKYFSCNSHAKNTFLQAEITSDLSYVLKRSSLPKKLRMEADTFRFNALIKQTDKNDPLKILSISPEWLLSMEVFYFDCSSRNKNIIKNIGIERLIDFCKLTVTELKLMPNMGQKSIKELSEDIINAQAKGPPPTTDTLNDVEGTLKEKFFISLAEIKDEKQRFIIEERLGVSDKSKTLDEIGSMLGVTREGVRQIQKKVIAKIIDGAFWDDILRMKLEKLLAAPTKPIYLSQMSEHDPWFDGFENNVNLLQKILKYFSHIKPKFLYLEDNILITSIDNDTWKSTKAALLDSFEHSLELRYTLEDTEMLIEHELAIKNAKELSSLMVDEIFPQLNFSFINGEMILTTIGNSIGNHVKTLLEQEENPLHYSEIRELYKQKYGVEHSIRNIHARLSNGGFYLFGRGIYGTEKHLKFTKEQQGKIIKFSEEYLEKNFPKQCHTHEILKAIKDIPFSESVQKLDNYSLNILMAKSDNLSYLGKMVWVHGVNGNTDTERLHIKKTVADILRKKGRAMRFEEIEKDISKVRSVSVNFSVNLQPNELFSRVDPATWGLLDRDFVLSPNEWSEIKEVLYQYLETTNKSLHTSELHYLVDNQHADTQITLGHIVGVLTSDDRFKKWQGGFIGLSSWSEPNRMTLPEALDKVIDKTTKTISTNMLENKIENLLGYSFEKNRMSMYLGKRGFTYNRRENLWEKVS